jgi:FlgD Ig-like domain
VRSPLVRAAFAVLVLATIAAFFLTQQLKSEAPVVLRFAVRPRAISPNGDGVRDRARVGFDLSAPATVTFSIIDGHGRVVRTLVEHRRLAGDRKYRYVWDGRDSRGRVVPDGVYRMRIVRPGEDRPLKSIKTILVDTRPPPVELTAARPSVIAPEPGRPARVRISYRGPRNVAPEFRVFRTDSGPTRVVLRLRGDHTRSALWDGFVRGHPAVDGDYTFSVTVRDEAGNRAVAPAPIPTRAVARPGTGVAVRHLTLIGRLRAVRAGGVARFAVGPTPRPVRFELIRLGSRRPLLAGRRRAGTLLLRVPRRARAGLYTVSVRYGAYSASWPLALDRGRRGPLVVLPLLTWQGENPVDAERDGFAETLRSARSLPLGIPFAGGALPPDLLRRAAPVLRELDRLGLPYTLVTDLDLVSGLGRGAGGAALAAPERWATPALMSALRGVGRLAVAGRFSPRPVRLARGDIVLVPGRLSAPPRLLPLGRGAALERTWRALERG